MSAPEPVEPAAEAPNVVPEPAKDVKPADPATTETAKAETPEVCFHLPTPHQLMLRTSVLWLFLYCWMLKYL